MLFSFSHDAYSVPPDSTDNRLIIKGRTHISICTCAHSGSTITEQLKARKKNTAERSFSSLCASWDWIRIPTEIIVKFQGSADPVNNSRTDLFCCSFHSKFREMLCAIMSLCFANRLACIIISDPIPRGGTVWEDSLSCCELFPPMLLGKGQSKTYIIRTIDSMA